MFDLPSVVPAVPAGAAGWGEKVSCPPVRLSGWDGAGMGRVREQEGKALDMQPAEAHASVFAVPKLREEVAAEITSQEHPFPPYLPSRTRYVAYIKVDDLLLPSLLP